MMRSGPFFSLRFAVLVCALAIGVLAIWIAAAEAISPTLPVFPRDADEARQFAVVRSRSTEAGLIGLIRGDLWTVAAIADAAPLLFETDQAKRTAFPRSDIDSARARAMHAAKLSPHDARNWLLLAALAGYSGGEEISGTEALKLSYYMGPANVALIPLRLAVATRAPAVADDEVKSLVAVEIQQVATKLPALRPALAAAYGQASPDGRKVIEVALTPIDAAFLDTIKRH